MPIFAPSKELLLNPLLVQAESPETVNAILRHILTSSEGLSVVNAVEVVLTLLKVGRPQSNSEEIDLNLKEKRRQEEVLRSTVAILGPSVSALTLLLTNKYPSSPLRSTACILDPPLGKIRLAIAKLFSGLLSTNLDIINQAVADTETTKILLDLFFKYPLNNLLHTQVVSCIESLVFWEEEIDPLSPIIEFENPALNKLLSSGRLFERLLLAWYPETFDPTVSYSGHVTKLTNILVSAMSEYPAVCCPSRIILLSHFKHLPKIIQKRWTELTSGKLLQINMLNEGKPVPPVFCPVCMCKVEVKDFQKHQKNCTSCRYKDEGCSYSNSRLKQLLKHIHHCLYGEHSTSDNQGPSASENESRHAAEKFGLLHPPQGCSDNRNEEDQQAAEKSSLLHPPQIPTDPSVTLKEEEFLSYRGEGSICPKGNPTSQDKSDEFNDFIKMSFFEFSKINNTSLDLGVDSPNIKVRDLARDSFTSVNDYSGEEMKARKKNESRKRSNFSKSGEERKKSSFLRSGDENPRQAWLLRMELLEQQILCMARQSKKQLKGLDDFLLKISEKGVSLQDMTLRSCVASHVENLVQTRLKGRILIFTPFYTMKPHSDFYCKNPNHTLTSVWFQSKPHAHSICVCIKWVNSPQPQ